jgi:hypothetical protein
LQETGTIIKENNIMARIGKIARLPRAVRSQLNSRLRDGEEGKQIVRWLNSLSHVKQVLAAFFDGRPINEQNLSDWRQGGYQEWLACQDILVQAADLAAHQRDLESAFPGQSFADHLAAAISFRYAAILAAPGVELDDKSLQQLKALGRTCQAVVKLRRSDQNAARLKMETERWKLEHLQILEDKVESEDRKQREALAAPVLGMFKKLERLEKLGYGEAARMAVDYLHEVETCRDPANFKSKVMTPERMAELRAHSEELAKNPPVKRDPMEAAMDLYTKMGDFIAKSRSKDRAVEPRAKRPSCARKPAPRRGPGGAATAQSAAGPAQAQTPATAGLRCMDGLDLVDGVKPETPAGAPSDPDISPSLPTAAPPSGGAGEIKAGKG